MIKKKNGAILVICLLLLSVVVVLVEQLARGVLVGAYFTRTMVEREHAKTLALNGVRLAMLQVGFEEKKKEEQGEIKQNQSADLGKESAEKKESKRLQKFLLRNLPHLNRWQSFYLKRQYDGIDGQIKICVSCEGGKININEAFDFKAQQFKSEYQMLLRGLEIKGKLAAGEILKRLTDFLKERNRKLDDISQLSDISEFKELDVFYSPPLAPVKEQKAQSKQTLALQDIFTTWTTDDKINPLWLSDSLCAILGLRRPFADDAKKRKEVFKNFVVNFKKEWTQDWATNWQYLEPLYEQRPQILDNVKRIFSSELLPKTFSVLSSGKVGNVEQTLLALIKEVEVKTGKDKKEKDGTQRQLPAQEAVKKQEQSDKAPEKEYKIIRLYWM
ncbi:MAG: hypothetical protein H6679_03170 [Epsilonproteobacteria bacterium]|nr:hypothetical protein [Campylobacterota bacterium]